MTECVRVVVIGGGVTGCGLAYHLARQGWTDVLLLEKNELTAGATWHAAGNVMHYASSALLTRLHKETTDLMPELEVETGQSVGFHRTGALRLITGAEQLVEYRRAAARASILGVEMDIVSVDEARQRFPLMRGEGLRAALWTPGDGHVDPSGVTFAYAKGARSRGVRIRTGTQVTGLDWTGEEWQVSTSSGPVRAEYVVNCAGMWSQELANMVGVTLPLIVFMHQHLVTEDHPALRALPRELALTRDPFGGFYCRQEGYGLLSGVYEHSPEFVFVDGIPPSFGMELMAPGFDRSADFIARAIERVPALGEVGIKAVYNGPTSRTPDHQPLLGPVPGLRNYFIAAGYAAGFVQAALTKYVAQWIIGGEPELDLSDLHVARFGVHADRDFAFDTVRAAHAFSNTPNYPYAERAAGRPAQTGPLYDRQAARRACFGVRGGVEVVNWYAPDDQEPREQYGFGRPAWHAVVGDECAAVTTGVGLVDLAHLYTFEVTGERAEPFLRGALASPLPAVGACAPALALTTRGTVATLLTVVRPEHGRFLLVGPGEQRIRDLDHLRRAASGEASVALNDVTGGIVRLQLMGPAAGDVVRSAARTDLAAPATTPLGFAGLLHLSYVPTVLARVDETAAGDWLLLAPSELARRLYDVLHGHGEAAGLRDVGVRAWDALRLEAGEPVVGVDIDRTLTPAEAGLDHLLASGQAGAGAASLGGAQPMARRRVLIATAEDPSSDRSTDPYRDDAVLDGDRRIGLVSTGGFGFRCRRGLAQAVVPAAFAVPGTELAIEVLGERCAAMVLAASPVRGPAASGPRPAQAGTARDGAALPG